MMLDRVKDKFDLVLERIIADTAYGSGPMLGWLVDHGGPCGANDEFLLATTAQNLCKLAKIFPASQQMRKAHKKGARALSDA
jgi:hypothetical protein